jgi:hypothetical protein
MRFGCDHVLSVARVQELARGPTDARCISPRCLAVFGAIHSTYVRYRVCETAVERYQSLCNMQYDLSRFGFWNGRRWLHPTM